MVHPASRDQKTTFSFVPGLRICTRVPATGMSTDGRTGGVGDVSMRIATTDDVRMTPTVPA